MSLKTKNHAKPQRLGRRNPTQSHEGIKLKWRTDNSQKITKVSIKYKQLLISENLRPFHPGECSPESFRGSGLRLVFVSRPFAVLFRKSPIGCAKTRERSRSRTICCGRDHSCFSRLHHCDTPMLLLRLSLGSHHRAVALIEPFAGPEYLSAVGFSPGT